MTTKPPDIFTEPAHVDPDTLANLGPLRRLAGVWQSDGGHDTAPKADGPERKGFVEHVTMQPIDPQTNGPQLLYGLRYHIHITTPGEAVTFHDQIGYWLWEPATGLVMQTLAIPRGQVALASGHAEPDARRIVVEATRGASGYGICSTDFLERAFRTDSYRLQIDFEDDGAWRYTEHTMLMVAGQAAPFEHHDTNRLVRIAEPDINPWLKILRAGAATA
ncbi:heme-binding beta-barrel domain-containing protein [Sphingomonas sp.]|uniref:FABP family protein n=1 Tax=Sphingomonas sp. TaxID=28214 RepID=UPI001ECDCAC4|nr:heme-binding beta-barrel domain-containing protein [Sphingomonas sp.]MBX3593268.1 FABP family protein [Sphingomonas sp.]